MRKNRAGRTHAALRLLGVAGMIAACATEGPPEDIAELALRNGTTIGALVGTADTAVVLVYSPEDCISCYGVASGWLSWKHARRGTLALVLTREPTPEEADVLSAYNLAPYEVLARNAEVLAPATHLFLHGRLVASAFVSPAQDFILSAMATR